MAENCQQFTVKKSPIRKRKKINACSDKPVKLAGLPAVVSLLLEVRVGSPLQSRITANGITFG